LLPATAFGLAAEGLSARNDVEKSFFSVSVTEFYDNLPVALFWGLRTR
jgi:hypothetical protein